MDVATAATVQAVAAGLAAATTIVLACLTARYVSLTAKMLAEVRGAREPSVELDVELNEDRLLLIVANRGATAARDVRIKIAAPIRWLESQGARLTDRPAFKEGLDFLGPGRRLKFDGGYVDWNLMSVTESHLNLGLSYSDSTKIQVSRNVSINVRQYDGATVDSFTSPTESIAHSLREINQRELEADTARRTKLQRRSSEPTD
jgi:hypothetical protein